MSTIELFPQCHSPIRSTKDWVLNTQASKCSTSAQKDSAYLASKSSIEMTPQTAEIVRAYIAPFDERLHLQEIVVNTILFYHKCLCTCQFQDEEFWAEVNADHRKWQSSKIYPDFLRWCEVDRGGKGCVRPGWKYQADIHTAGKLKMVYMVLNPDGNSRLPPS